MDKYRIVPARREHLHALPAIERECARLFPPGAIPAPLLDDATSEETLDDARAKGNVWVAESAEGQPVGFALLEFPDSYALLVEMDVLPAHGRRGIGTALVRRVAERVRSAGGDVLFLTTFAHIPWNAPFYSRLGFVVLWREEMPDCMARILAEEHECGFTDRVAMRLDLLAQDG